MTAIIGRMGALDLSGVTKVFDGGEGSVHAFGPADLSIMSGEFVSLLGRRDAASRPSC